MNAYVHILDNRKKGHKYCTNSRNNTSGSSRDVIRNITKRLRLGLINQIHSLKRLQRLT